MATETTSADTPKSDSPDLAAEAVNYLTKGKRHLVCNEIAPAVDNLQEACRLLAAQYGEDANECAEAYLYYGRSLLELARIENGVLGNALDGVPDEGDESLPKSEKYENADDLPEDEEEGGETSQEEGEATSQDEGEDVEETGKDEEDPDDVPNLQLAWEMLELARSIFSRGDTKEMKLRVADCHNYLGEVSLETEQYESAIGDFQSCLKIQQEHLEADNRIIAETHYQLGLAYLFNKQYDLSIESLKNAVSCIKDKIANLTKIVEADTSKGKEISTADNPIEAAHKEIKELNEILPDILNKVDDATEEKRNAEQMKKQALLKAKEELAATLGFGSSSEAGTSSSGFSSLSSSSAAPVPINNITSMIRKKRKPEDEAAQNGDVKKSRAENGSGDSVANGHANGLNGTEASPEKTEIKVKTVEDVQKAKEAAAQSSS